MKTRILFLALFLINTLCFSQTDTLPMTKAQIDSTEAEQKIQMEIWTLDFRFERPDDSFSELTDGIGYDNAEGLRVVLFPFPQAYRIVLQSYTKPKLTVMDSVIHRQKLTLNGHSGYLVKGIMRSPDNKNEDRIMLSFIYPYKKATINMIAAYPVSKDAALYAKMLRVFGTAEEVKK